MLIAGPRFSPGWGIAAAVAVLAAAAAGIWIAVRRPSQAAARVWVMAVWDLTALLLAAAVWREFGQPAWLAALLLMVAIAAVVGAQLRARVLFAWFQEHPARSRLLASGGGAAGALGYALGLTAGRIFGTGAGKVLLPLVFLTFLVLAAIMHMLWGAAASAERAGSAESSTR